MQIEDYGLRIDLYPEINVLSNCQSIMVNSWNDVPEFSINKEQEVSILYNGREFDCWFSLRSEKIVVDYWEINSPQALSPQLKLPPETSLKDLVTKAFEKYNLPLPKELKDVS